MFGRSERGGRVTPQAARQKVNLRIKKNEYKAISQKMNKNHWGRSPQPASLIPGVLSIGVSVIRFVDERITRTNLCKLVLVVVY